MADREPEFAKRDFTGAEDSRICLFIQFDIFTSISRPAEHRAVTDRPSATTYGPRKFQDLQLTILQ